MSKYIKTFSICIDDEEGHLLRKSSEKNSVTSKGTFKCTYSDNDKSAFKSYSPLNSLILIIPSGTVFLTYNGGLPT